MKKIPNNVRINMVPRDDGALKSNEDQVTNVQEQINTQGNHNVSNKDLFHAQQYFPRVTSPNHVRIHDVNDMYAKKQQPRPTNDLTSQLSVSTVHPQHKESVDSLYEIPTKTNPAKTKKVLVGVAVAAVIGGLIIAGIVVAVLFTRSSNTATTSSSPSTTTIPTTVISAYWSFDNTSTDLYGVYNGNNSNGATFVAGTGTAVPFVGYGQALYVNGSGSQQFSVSTPSLNLNSTSFTIEAWIYSLTLVGDRGIFGQCQCSSCTNQCFFFICRNGRLYVGFTSSELSGTINMAVNTWYHVAFVYNSQTQQQILYVNGVQDSISYNVPAYQGKNGSIQIGSTQVYSATNYFTGYIDNVMITTRAKSTSEILSDASVVVYYSFDLPYPNIDDGPNRLNGTINNTVTTNGRVNQAMRFTGTQSNFQAYGLYQVPYGVVANRPFSISMWIYPTSITSCTFLQTYSGSLNNGWCTNFLGIYSPGGSIGQLFVMSSNGWPSLITGQYVTQNTWSHVSVTYSPTNGYTLYYNGNYFGTTGNMSYTINSATYAYLFVGFALGCNPGSVNIGYQGSIDELYVHSRELTQADVTALANP